MVDLSYYDAYMKFFENRAKINMSYYEWVEQQKKLEKLKKSMRYEKMEKKKKVKETKHKLKATKSLSEDGENILLQLSINKPLQKLINEFVVRNERRYIDGTTETQRFLVKKALTNSINFGRYKQYFFATELVDEGKVTLKLHSGHNYDEFINNMNHISEMIREMEQLKQKEIVSVEFCTKKITNNRQEETND